MREADRIAERLRAALTSNNELAAALEKCIDLAENSDGRSVSARLCAIVDEAQAALKRARGESC